MSKKMILLERSETNGRANIFPMNGFKNSKGSTVRIFPGMNSIDPDIEGVIGSKDGKAVIGKIVESPAWKEMIECGVHKIVSTSSESEGGDSQDLTEMSVKEAKAIIKLINNSDQLKVILTKEQGLNKPRSSIIDAIQDKIQSVRDDKAGE